MNHLHEVTTLASALIQSGKASVDDPAKFGKQLRTLWEAVKDVAGQVEDSRPAAKESALNDKTIYATTQGDILFQGNSVYVWPQVLQLAQFLAENAGQVYSTQDLITNVLGGTQGPYAVYTVVGDLRRALGPLGNKIVQSGRGRKAGYSWNKDYPLVMK